MCFSDLNVKQLLFDSSEASEVEMGHFISCPRGLLTDSNLVRRQDNI